MNLRVLAAALALSLSAPPAVLALSDPARAAESISVTWPDLTSFNPDVRDYTFEVSYSGSQQLYAWFTVYGEDTRVPIPSVGEVDMTFAPNDDGRKGPVLVGPCDPGAACTVLATSPEVTVVRRAQLFWVRPSGRTPVLSPQQTELRLQTFPRDLDLTAAYSVERGGVVVADGTLPVVRDGEQDFLSLAEVVPAFTKAGDHRFYVTLSGESPDYGQLSSGRYGMTFEWDDTVKMDPRLDQPVLYPVKDGYRDVATLRVGSEDLRELIVEVLNDEGDVVKRSYGPRPVAGGGEIVRFDGRADGALLPAGAYTWQLQATDLVGNTTLVHVPFSLSHRSVRTQEWSKTFRAASTVVDTGVGSCSQLKKGRKGRLGYYSQTSCARADDSTVITLNRAYVPQSFTGNWSRLRVTTTGGGATGRGDYLVVYNRDTSGKDQHRLELDSRRGRHRGDLIAKNVKRYIHNADGTGRPYVLWVAGLTNGSRYDVNSFTVEVSHTVLR